MRFKSGLSAAVGAIVGMLSLLPQSVSASEVADEATASSGERFRDPFVGTWSGDCGDLVQCDLMIKLVDEVYILELTIADWKNANDVLCRLSGNMNIGTDRQYLAGKMGSSPLSGAFLRGAGVLELHAVPDMDCGRPYALDGIYRILGD